MGKSWEFFGKNLGKSREKVGSFWKVLSDIMVLSEEKGRMTVRGRSITVYRSAFLFELEKEVMEN